MDILSPISAGSTGVLIQFFVQNNSLPGIQGLVGLTAASSGLSASYRLRGVATGGTTITLTAGTRGTWASGSFVEIDSAAMPGWYELGIPNAALTNTVTAGDSVDFTLEGALNMAETIIKQPFKSGSPPPPPPGSRPPPFIYSLGVSPGDMAAPASGNPRIWKITP